MALMPCPLRVCDRQKENMSVQLLDRLRLLWSVPLDRLRSPRSAIMVAQVQSTDVRIPTYIMLSEA